MSTVKAVNLQHPNSSNINMVLDQYGAVSGGLPSPNRNLFYNGAMQVHQRGTSTTGINQSSGDAFVADRWGTGMYNAATGTYTMSIENDAPTGSGFRKSVKLLCTTGATIGASAVASLYQRFEGQDLQRIAKGTSSAKPLTLSFWVKSNVVGTYAIRFNDVNNSRIFVANYSVVSSGTWEQKTIVVPADTTGAFNNDNALSLVINFYIVSGSSNNSGTPSNTWVTSGSEAAGMNVNIGATTNNYWQITGAQLETGSIPTPFEFKSYGQELRECQRYYWRQTAENTYAQFGSGAIYGTTGAFVDVSFPCPMRAAATSVESNALQIMNYGTSTYTVTALAISGNRSGTNRALLNITTAGGMTASQACFLAANNNASAYLGFSAEL
jgi:hypothetical protein